MKYNTITQINSKGQVVIPKAVRETLSITKDTLLKIVARGEGVYLYPVKEVAIGQGANDAYLKILEMAQGSWGPATKEEIAWEKKKRKLGLKAAKRRRNAW